MPLFYCSLIHTCSIVEFDRLCGLVVRLPGWRPKGPGFDSRRCQIFWVAVGLKRGPLSPCEDKWGDAWKKSSGSGLENWDYLPWGIRRADHATPLYPQRLALYFANKWRSISWYSSLADWRPRNLFDCGIRRTQTSILLIMRLGMLRRMVPVRIDVSEERFASIIKVTKSAS
jgi:hypothetical protein